MSSFYIYLSYLMIRFVVVFYWFATLFLLVGFISFDMVLCCFLFSSEHEFNNFLWSFCYIRWRSIGKRLGLAWHQMIVLRQMLKDYIQLDHCRSYVLLWTRWWTYGFYDRTRGEGYKLARNTVPDNYCWKCL